ncbi:hypothetical protein LTR12_001881 [Friedmanniomyces endolithicus]|nr:hypothetical protein LTR12_001881 [Friedmanniomyces endolithicus]
MLSRTREKLTVGASITVPVKSKDHVPGCFDRPTRVLTSDTDGIKKTLNAYRDNLVASNVEGCVNLYASDGVLMAPGYETQVGHDAVKQWYTNIRKLVTLDVEFDIHEAVAITEEYGFARTSSAGTLKINATGVTRKEANQELFVMKKVEGEWKIARYCFSESKPPE